MTNYHRHKSLAEQNRSGVLALIAHLSDDVEVVGSAEVSEAAGWQNCHIQSVDPRLTRRMQG
jgi:hypothetical protein